MASELAERETSEESTEKTVTTSFRMNAEVYRVLHSNAQEKDVSLNSLVNHILRSYTEFGMYQSKFKAIVTSQLMFTELMDSLGDEALAQVGSMAGAEVPKSLISAMYGELNLKNAVRFLKVVAAHTSDWRYSETAGGGGTTIVLAHDLGRKGSIYFANYFDSMFRVVGVRPKISQTDNSVTLRF